MNTRDEARTTRARIENASPFQRCSRPHMGVAGARCHYASLAGASVLGRGGRRTEQKINRRPKSGQRSGYTLANAPPTAARMRELCRGGTHASGSGNCPASRASGALPRRTGAALGRRDARAGQAGARDAVARPVERRHRPGPRRALEQVHGRRERALREALGDRGRRRERRLRRLQER